MIKNGLRKIQNATRAMFASERDCVDVQPCRAESNVKAPRTEHGQPDLPRRMDERHDYACNVPTHSDRRAHTVEEARKANKISPM
jgi:hypothetical protein